MNIREKIKWKKQTEQKLREIWDSNKKFKIRINGWHEEREWTKRAFEEIVVENFQNLA